MKYFGIDRVIEPVGTIPPTAWKIDNSRELSPGEMRVSLDMVKIEDSNFAQIVSVANYVDSKMKHRILDIVNIRGRIILDLPFFLPLTFITFIPSVILAFINDISFFILTL